MRTALLSVVLIALLAPIAAPAQTASAERVSRVIAAEGAPLDLRPESGWIVTPDTQFFLRGWCGPAGGCQWYVEQPADAPHEGEPMSAWETRTTLLPTGAAVRFLGDGIAYIWPADGTGTAIPMPTWRCLKASLPGGYELRCGNPGR